MADALAEMTKRYIYIYIYASHTSQDYNKIIDNSSHLFALLIRSSYFQQIEEDVRKYSKEITELRSSISNFKTKEMTELVKFHKVIESVLENLTDESQVSIYKKKPRTIPHCCRWFLYKLVNYEHARHTYEFLLSSRYCRDLKVSLRRSWKL